MIEDLTGLCKVGDILKKNSIRNVEVEALTRIRGDQRALIISSIKDHLTKYVAYGISYKIYFRNREGSTLAGVAYIAHKMIIVGKNFDLCSLLKEQLMENVQLTMDIDYYFKFGTLATCILMYFLNCMPLKYNVVLKGNIPICKQIFNHYNSFENCEQVYDSFFRKVLMRFGEGGASLPARITETGSSFGKGDKENKRKRVSNDVTPSAPRPIDIKRKEISQVFVDIEDESSEEYIPCETLQNQLNWNFLLL